MRVPREKAAGFTGVTILAAVLLYIVVGEVSGAFLGMFVGGLGSHMADRSGTVSGKVELPDRGMCDRGALNYTAVQTR